MQVHLSALTCAGDLPLSLNDLPAKGAGIFDVEPILDASLVEVMVSLAVNNNNVVAWLILGQADGAF